MVAGPLTMSASVDIPVEGLGVADCGTGLDRAGRGLVTALGPAGLYLAGSGW